MRTCAGQRALRRSDRTTRYEVEILSALDRPVQQHQPGRSSALLTALAMLGDRRIRLLELGACAGLNLVPDLYHWQGNGWVWGDPEAQVRLTSDGRGPGPVEFLERAGCDLLPLDPGDPDHVAISRSFLPFEDEAADRALTAALKTVADSGLRVAKSDAGAWLEEKLSQDTAPTARTVVWHSLFWHYLTAEEQNSIEETLDRAVVRTRLVRVGLEPSRWARPARLQITVYS